MGKLRHITKWLSRWLPGCYCRACPGCTGFADHYFPYRHMQVCEHCLTCPDAFSALYGYKPEWKGGSPSVFSFRMSRVWKARHWLQGFLSWVGHFIGPKFHPPVLSRRSIKLSRRKWT